MLLMQKDLPLLRSVIPLEFTAVLVKGRGNYLSMRRMNSASARTRRSAMRRSRSDAASANRWAAGTA